MTEDLEKKNKPDAILNKKTKATEPKTIDSKLAEPKKKVVVKRAKPIVVKAKKAEDSSKDSISENAEKDSAKKAVVSKKEKPAKEPKIKVKKGKRKPEEEKDVKKPASVKQKEEPREKKPQTHSYAAAGANILNQRPNIKAGNLADSAKRGQRGQDGFRGHDNHKGQSGGFRGGQRSGGGFGNKREGGFSGSQARAYSDGKKQGFKSGGQNFQRKNDKNGSFGFRGPKPAPVAPIPVEKNKSQTNKKAYTKKKEIYNKKNKEDEFFAEKMLNQKKKAAEKARNIPKSIEMMESISVSELAKKMNLKASELIGKLMEMGMMVTMNQSIDSDTATILAAEYDCDVKIVSLYDETIIETKEDAESDLQPRPPVVTIMGHVDHGKTKTLDAIRSTNVIAKEFGGITQHIGAYTVETAGGKITFLDTPGHEAFTMMRARGAEITDIVVLVVAADDGVMPQTIEAINHARDAKVPIIVAVNKVDKPEANVDRVKKRLSELDLMPEEWGGDTMFVEISALKKQGLDTLLETILLQAEVLELKANYTCNAEGKVIESRIDHGRGVVATIVVQRGILRTGDPYVAGIYSGRVRAIFNDRGEKVEEASPSMPVEILGLEGMPNAGDPFQVTESERIARQISDKRQELRRFEDSRNVKKVTLDNLYETISEGEILELKVIIKGDVQGSVEALKQSLEKLSTPEIRLVAIHASAGAINDSDVMLAAADTNAIIIGFNVRPTPQAKLLAEQEKVDIRKYTVIYKAVEEIQAAMEGMLSPDLKEQVIGMVEVRNTFKVPKIGKIAGCYVLDGVVKRNCSVHVIRQGIVVHTGKLSSLKRFKDDAKEVAAGFECGIGIENFNDIMVDDQIEIIETIEVARKLSDTKNYAAPEIKTEEAKNE